MDGIKSQDLGLLLKLVSLQKQERFGPGYKTRQAWPHDWQDWDDEGEFSTPWMEELFGNEVSYSAAYTVRNLEAETGIGKSQVSKSLRRSFDVGLAKKIEKPACHALIQKACMSSLCTGLNMCFRPNPVSWLGQ